MAFEVEITRNGSDSGIFFLYQRDRIDPLLSLWEKTGYKKLLAPVFSVLFLGRLMVFSRY